MSKPPPNDLGLADETQYHHGNLRRALIDAALDLLNEGQNWDFSLREVARKAKVSHTAPYNHFAGKHDLLEAVGAAGYDRLRERMQEAAAHASDTASALKAIGVAYVLFGVENPAHYRLMFGAALAAHKNKATSVIEQSGAATKAVMTGIIRQGAESGLFDVHLENTSALDMVVLSAWSLVHGLTMLLIDGLATPAPILPPAAEQIADHITQMLLDSLSPKS